MWTTLSLTLIKGETMTQSMRLVKDVIIKQSPDIKAIMETLDTFQIRGHLSITNGISSFIGYDYKTQQWIKF
tara:strand:- start:1952 stop:2167 length:216 start_codon:yes stop_codon:yes gene_type:complete